MIGHLWGDRLVSGLRGGREVGELVLANWDELNQPDTSYGDAWRILDLDPLPGDDGKQVPFDPDDPESFMPPCD